MGFWRHVQTHNRLEVSRKRIALGQNSRSTMSSPDLMLPIS
jgi:hypothetical protein